ncbi:MAG: 3'(2'),5'-bisphosphate nucleotidase CysQ [Chitinophagales bacterium]|nr:3'(2'),5'-bisphosphate nucleotidase CysQ [Chitinophagales bacterium]
MKFEIKALINIAREAGDAILEIYEKDFEVYTKNDQSPLTEADKISNNIIIEGLIQKYPDIPIISEENKQLPYSERKNWEYCFIVDPLDGTKEFIKKNGEFTVNIALVQNGKPIAGVVHVPVSNTSYYAEEGKGAYKLEFNGAPQQLVNETHYTQLDKIVVVASRSHLTQEVVDFVDKLKAEGKEVDFLSAGSSLKFCLVAEGKANVYPRFAPTMEWDTAAAHAVCIEAGKNVFVYPNMNPLTYNREDLLNPWFIVE